MDDEPISSENEEGNTFIHKLLGEMKNVFNKTETRLVQAEVTSAAGYKSSNDGANLECVQINDVRKENINAEEKEPLKIEIIQVNPYECDLDNDEDAVVTNVDLTHMIKMKDEGVCKPIEREVNEDSISFRKPENSLRLKKKTDDVKTLRTKHHGIELKRSTRRRKSGDNCESVLQSAIARKEKSYNESAKPQRLSRQLKPTPKILENLANAAAVREKSKKVLKFAEKHRVADNDMARSPLNETCKRTKSPGKHNRKNVKRLKVDRVENDFDSDSEFICDSNVEDNAKKHPSTFSNNIKEEKTHRKSPRILSRSREENTLNIEELQGATQLHGFPRSPTTDYLTKETKDSHSKSCLCTQPTRLYASSDVDKIVFCMGIDSVGEKLVGCNNMVENKDLQFVRSSTRVPYVILCEVHKQRMLRHNCCPTCGVFCTQGRFAECPSKHYYHRECQRSVNNAQNCPHCNLNSESDVYITMYSIRKPAFLTKQTALYPQARMTFPVCYLDDETKHNLSPLLPPECVQLTTPTHNGIDEPYTAQSIFQAVKEEKYTKLAEILGSRSVDLVHLTCYQEDNLTILHYSAQNGFLTAVHLLVTAGVDLDALDNTQNTPLMLAIANLKNDVVKYLISVGASFTFKGMDGMTALHMAAERGNLTACELLVEASVDKRGYVNLIDDGGWTSLVWACENNHADVARYLLRKGADPTLRDLKQNVALHWAAFSSTREIVELLLSYENNVNVVNALGDTPVHNAARQGNYNVLIVLLARGGCPSTLNKLEETPLDYAQPYGDCFDLISLNIRLRPNAKQNLVIVNDISNGREVNPIQCVNTVDEETQPRDYTYISQNCVTTDINIDRRVSIVHPCHCENNCDGDDCHCGQTSVANWYDEDGHLVSKFDYTDVPMIFECNQFCSCNVLTCKNRVVQRGLSQRFQIYRTENKGWAVKTLGLIPKGSFVCEYIGEIITDLEADQRDDDSYLFDLDNRENDTFCIDAKKYGNIARFINHSCEPNLIPIKVFIDYQDLRFPRIALFSKRIIEAGEEISFDYGERFWIVKYKKFTCDCKSETCKYSEGTIRTTLENYQKRFQELEVSGKGKVQ